jgi:hypothetical protein
MTDLHTNPTQLTGLLAFALATLACAAAARRGPGAARWRRLAWLQAACWAEVLFGVRHRAHDMVDALLQARGWYAARGPLQVVLLVAVLVLAAATLAALARLRHLDARLWTAACATAMALWLFVTEAVSLHGVDAVMYLTLGPVLLIGCAWAACAAVVVGAAMRAALGPAPVPHVLRPETVPARRR